MISIGNIKLNNNKTEYYQSSSSSKSNNKKFNNKSTTTTTLSQNQQTNKHLQSQQPVVVSFFQKLIGVGSNSSSAASSSSNSNTNSSISTYGRSKSCSRLTTTTTNSDSDNSEIINYKHKNKKEFIPKRSTTIDEFKSVQSLKQFWINAFGGGSSNSNSNSNNIAIEKNKKNDNNLKNKSATLGSVRTNVSSLNELVVIDRGKKSQTLQRNSTTVISNLSDNDVVRRRNGDSNDNIHDDDDDDGYDDDNDELISAAQKLNRLSKSTDNFYKYKTADLVKNVRNSGEGFLTLSTGRSITTPTPIVTSTIATTTIATTTTTAPATDITTKSSSSIVDGNSVTNTPQITKSNTTEIMQIHNKQHQLTNDKAMTSSNNNNNNNTSTQSLTTITKPKKTEMVIRLTNNDNEVDNKTIYHTNTTMAIKQHTINETVVDDNTIMKTLPIVESTIQQQITSKLENNNISKNSSTNSLVTITSVDSSQQLTPKHRLSATSVTRKCSFRTNQRHHHQHHHHMHLHHQKKMAANGITTVNSSITTNGKVAALAHRFNQLIQQDADIVEEVKRNKELILHRSGGHIFKVVADNNDDNNDNDTNKKDMLISKRGTLKRTTSNIGVVNLSDNKKNNQLDQQTQSHKSVKKKPSIKRKISKSVVNNNNNNNKSIEQQENVISNPPSITPQLVQNTIQLFEKTENSPNCSEENSLATAVTNTTEDNNNKSTADQRQLLLKPKIPDKSAQVLQRTKEIAIRNSQKKVKQLLTSNISESSNENHNEKHDKRFTLSKIKEDTEDLTTNYTKNQLITSEEKHITLDDCNATTVNDDQIYEKSKKSKYTRIYEKFRFKSPFGVNKKYQSTSEVSIDSSVSSAVTEKVIDEFSAIDHHDHQSTKAVEKIVDALSSVNKRIDHLSKSETCISTATKMDEKYRTQIINANNNKMKPNRSFLFRTTSKNDGEKVPTIVEAINKLVIINKSQSMDEIRLSNNNRDFIEHDQPLSPTLSTSSEDDIDNLNTEINKEEIPPLPTSTPPNYSINNSTNINDDEYEVIKPQIKLNTNDSSLLNDNNQDKSKQNLIITSIIIDDYNNIDSSNIYQSIFEVESTKTISTIKNSPTSPISSPISPISLTNEIPNDSFLYGKCGEKIDDNESIYQSISEVKKIQNLNEKSIKNNKSIIGYCSESINSYESYENYEIVDDDLLEKIKNENGYEIYDPNILPPEPPPPRLATIPITIVPAVTNTTNNITVGTTVSINTPESPTEQPPLPVPKRNLTSSNYNLQKSDSLSSNYEIIKYYKCPPRPPPPKIPSSDPMTKVTSENQMKIINNHEHLNDEYQINENIYDTIKTIPNNNNIKSTSTVSDYESIHSQSPMFRLKQHNKQNHQQQQHQQQQQQQQRHQVQSTTGTGDSDSGSTLSSDNKTNSLYGTHMSNDTSSSTPSEIGGGGSIGGRSSSIGDNSDEWIDISDGENEQNGQKHKFIIVCERKKCHRNQDWSKKVRDQRMNQQNNQESYEDGDSDHYYESLEAATKGQTMSTTSPLYLVNGADNSATYSQSQQQQIINSPQNDDEYDSFDSDDESDEDVKKNDSGVDISSTRLPDPPPPTNQVYAFMQKIKNFGSLSKNLTKLAKKKHSKSEFDPSTLSINNSSGSGSGLSPLRPPVDHLQQYQHHHQLPHETAQFYVRNEYQNVQSPQLPEISQNTKGRSKIQKINKKKESPEDPYQNMEFHSPPPPPRTMLQPPPTVPPPVTPTTPTSNTSPQPQVFTRKKTKSGKSFKSKLRKSLGPDTTINLGNSFNGTRSTFYISDSVDIDSGVFTNGCGGSGNNISTSSSSDIHNVSSLSVGVASASDISCSSTIGENDVTKDDGSPSPLISTTPIPSEYTPPRSTKIPEVTQRKSSLLTIRPNNPPPPPPIITDSNTRKTKRQTSTTSWYAECGVFKTTNLVTDSTDLSSPKLNDSANNNINNKKERTSSSSWYADVGLYQTTSGASVASSSGSSGVSTGGECASGDDNSHSMFFNEPLYQIYSAAKLESINQDIEMENDHSDGYEEIGSAQQKLRAEQEQQHEHQQQHQHLDQSTDLDINNKVIQRQKSRPTALQLVGPKQGPSRTLWSEIPEVINSQILVTLTTTEKRLQEAKFEILTSEASYLKSLSLLRSHFMNHPAFRDPAILNSSDRKTLFSYMISVQECSDRLLSDLENCWQDNIMLLGLSHSVYKHAEKYFHVYIAYCEHQGKLDRTLKRLKESRPSPFTQTLDNLEIDAICCGLSLHSFLMLPMQRITRLPLLVDAVLSKLKSDDDEYESWQMTLAILNKIVGQCNDAANRSAQNYEMEILSRQIEFPQNIRPLAIVPVGVPAAGTPARRSLIRRGEINHLIWRGDDGKLTFGKKFTKTQIYVFLFTDLLVLSKRRSAGEETFTVFDYCPRSLLTVSSGEVIPQLPTKDLPLAGKHLVYLTLLENHDGKMVEMILSCNSETDRQRWLQALEPPCSENPDEKLYEQWDCPQVIAKHTYTALQPDELGLDPGDVVNVTRKMMDGWYQGERIRDGALGWFPGNYTEEVASAHVRARNLKQRYRLLTFTAAYWESQKKK